VYAQSCVVTAMAEIPKRWEPQYTQLKEHEDKHPSFEVGAKIIEELGAAEAALRRCKELFDVALPKFDWGKSFLDAKAIRLLNDVPCEVERILWKANQ
jgi:hypothetical protein